MRTWLAWLFPLWALLPTARRLGSVSFQEVEGVGWQCAIRPPISHVRRRGAINAWSGQAASMGRAIKAAIAHAAEHPHVSFDGDPTHGPKLGGAEFDA